MFIFRIEQNQTLAKYFVTFKHCGDKNKYQTRAFTKRILDTPLYKTNAYSAHSAKYHCILDWKGFKKDFKRIFQFKRILPNLSETDYTYSKIKSLIK